MVALGVDRGVELDGRAPPVVTAQRVADPEHHPAQRGRQHRRREHADPGLVGELGVVEGEVDDEQRDGEPDARQRGAAGELPAREARRQPPEAQPDRGPDAEQDAQQLAQHETRDDADRDR